MTMGIDTIHYFSEKECYIISWYDEIDGCTYPVLEAINRIRDIGLASIAILTNFRIIKTEQVKGAAEIFIWENSGMYYYTEKICDKIYYFHAYDG